MTKKTRLPKTAAAKLCSGTLLILLALWLIAPQANAASFLLFTNDFEAYTDVATNLSDTANANPTGAEWNIADDNALNPTTAGAGVQVIDWLAHTGSKSLLLRSSSEAQVYLTNARSGTNYTLEFWTHAVRGPGDRNWYIILRAMGSDSNGDDHLAYRTDRGTSSNIFYFDGIGPTAAAFIDTGADHIDNQWQHHRLVFDSASQTCAIYVDDMVTPIVAAADFARPDTSVPSLLIIRHEGNSADDGYFAIDDIRFTVDGAIDLATTFTDGFESYPARTNETDNANPGGPWITVESAGTGSGRSLALNKVQVVDSSVVTPRSGNKSLKLEGGQRAGASIAWGHTPQSDVQITWWAHVPPAVANNPTPDAVYLRMSLYGVEGASSYAGDAALLGYGIRSSPLTGDATSLIYFAANWTDTLLDFTPVVWEQYRLTTHVSQGRYSILKNPSSANPEVLVDRAAFIGSAGTYGPIFMAAWSSSNGSNHPPVYIDDIEIKSLVSTAEPLPDPYTVSNHTARFTNVTILKTPGPAGGVAVDPRDTNSILFTVDSTSGGIFRARKVASGNWAIDPVPVVTSLSQPSGLTVGADGTLWWTHDFTMSLKRLSAPWESNAVEEVIVNFGPDPTDDDPIDVTIAPTNFTGSLGQPNQIVVADRGTDGDAFNSVFLVDPATTSLGQTGYTNFLITPTTAGLGSGNLNAITALPQYGEVVTLNLDGTITAINGSGAQRTILPAVLWTDIFSGGPLPSAQAIAVDPITGKLWVADDVRDEIWSIDPNPATEGAAPDQKEISFPLTDENRPDLQLDVHDPGLAFAPDGSFMVLADASTQNGGGRLIIFHNEAIALPPFKVTSITRSANSVQLIWESAGSATYRVLRSFDLGNPTGFQDISGNLSTTQFTDTNSPAGTAYYRVIANP